jgi:hypothetical protein
MQIGSTQTKESLAFTAISKFKETPSRRCAQGGDDNGFGVMAGISRSDQKLNVVIANYQISSTLMGPIPCGNEETLAGLAVMTYPDRWSFTYPDKNGYDLTIKSIPGLVGRRDDQAVPHRREQQLRRGDDEDGEGRGSRARSHDLGFLDPGDRQHQRLQGRSARTRPARGDRLGRNHGGHGPRCERVTQAL